jgi:hypothetical protein
MTSLQASSLKALVNFRAIGGAPFSGQITRPSPRPPFVGKVTISSSRNFASFVDILQILVSTRRFSKITPLPRSMAYLQMRYREDAKDAKSREEENKS